LITVYIPFGSKPSELSCIQPYSGTFRADIDFVSSENMGFQAYFASGAYRGGICGFFKMFPIAKRAETHGAVKCFGAIIADPLCHERDLLLGFMIKELNAIGEVNIVHLNTQ